MGISALMHLMSGQLLSCVWAENRVSRAALLQHRWWVLTQEGPSAAVVVQMGVSHVKQPAVERK